jgi:peroxiredoxin
MRPDLQPGNPFPDFEMRDDEGAPFRLSSYAQGQPTAVIFVRGHY